MQNMTTLDERRAKSFASAMLMYRNARIDLIATPDRDDDDENDRLCDLLSVAEDHLFDNEAPDIAGILAKFEIATRDNGPISPHEAESIRSDLMRIGKIERSPTFLPQEWMDSFEFNGGKTTVMGEGTPALVVPAGNNRAAEKVVNLRPEEREALQEYLSANSIKAA